MPESDDFAPAFAELLRTRRSINDFASRPVARESIQRALDLARWAPNHKLTEPWRFHLLGPASASAIVELSAAPLEKSKGAAAAQARRDKWNQVPGWLVVTCQKSPADAFRQQEDYAACCCAIQNLCLALWSEGIGTKWTTGDVTRLPEFNSLLNLDTERELVVGMIWFGYPAAVPPGRRKEVSEILIEHP